MKKVVINGFFYANAITGVQRYSHEIIKELDKIVLPNIYEILVPIWLETLPDLKNIKVVKWGKSRKHQLWLQYDLYRYCKKEDALCVCLCSTAPFLYFENSIITVHDAATLAHPEFYSLKYLLFNKLLMWKPLKRAKRVLTVSQFSKNEIQKYYRNDIAIDIVPNAWQHMEQITYDENVFNKYSALKDQKYCFSMSSLSPNKNFKWILEVAKKNPDYMFAIAGMKLDLFADADFDSVPHNVHFLGYVSDEEAKTLMRDCEVYLFPTLYEGFGITPLEAMSVGAKIVVSDTPCMHEVYEDAAVFIDPQKYNYKIRDLICGQEKMKDSVDKILLKYSWEKSARLIKDLN